MMENPPREVVELVCSRCELQPTKPGNEPPHLVPALVAANDIFERRMGLGENFDLDSLTPRQRAAYRAFTRAEARSKKLRYKDIEKKNAQMATNNAARPTGGSPVPPRIDPLKYGVP